MSKVLFQCFNGSNFGIVTFTSLRSRHKGNLILCIMYLRVKITHFIHTRLDPKQHSTLLNSVSGKHSLFYFLYYFNILFSRVVCGSAGSAHPDVPYIDNKATGVLSHCLLCANGRLLCRELFFLYIYIDVQRPLNHQRHVKLS